MEITNLNIVMLLFQPSVVARGLEKKLTELGNSVSSLVGDLSEVEDHIDKTDLFIFNLPNKIADDTKELKTLVSVANTITSKGGRMIMVGEKEVWTELLKIYRGISQFVWVFRPVEMDELTTAIEKAISENHPKPGKPKRILIVDDDPDYAKVVRSWIRDSYKVDIVTNGMSAITFLLKVPKDEKVDLILLDYEMPVVDGTQVLQMLRQEPETAGIPVVFLTGVGTREGVERVMELKPDGYILKSTPKENLLSFLQTKLNA